ncbi:beta-1,3-glucan-binding protein-like isoform X2 [Copidosoma floridanum]|uniref:beta-1,3-glucan-binding protein-like isoform X2 n=1 Tax=Copidosoma floridanum TaxID=29053 RepID=UPI000C6F7B63|nr:beta-1,3-glucan-binding protein-like isoform X2 [Copidosoma floridanum]
MEPSRTRSIGSNSVLASLAILLASINSNRENVFCAAATTGHLIFEENFDAFEPSRWSREIKIPLDPDFEFCTFHKHWETVDFRNGIFRIKPSLFEDDYGEDAVFIGQMRLADCSSTIQQECQQHAASYHILPPIVSAKIVTKNHFEFRYGVIEVRAKFPEGDWLYPEIWLEPLYKSYDKQYANARINLGLARGNAVLTRTGNITEDYGARLLEFGVGYGNGANFQESLVKKISPKNQPWNKAWHVYKTIWTSRGFVFYVDEEEVGRLTPTTSGWSSNVDAVPDKMMPFDEKFYVTIGLGVGGIRAFPDNTQTDSYLKPWKNVNAKAMLYFWEAKNKWLPSWQRYGGSKAALESQILSCAVA